MSRLPPWKTKVSRPPPPLHAIPLPQEGERAQASGFLSPFCSPPTPRQRTQVSRRALPGTIRAPSSARPRIRALRVPPISSLPKAAQGCLSLDKYPGQGRPTPAGGEGVMGAISLAYEWGRECSQGWGTQVSEPHPAPLTCYEPWTLLPSQSQKEPRHLGSP